MGLKSKFLMVALELLSESDIHRSFIDDIVSCFATSILF